LLPSGSCSESSAILHEVSGQTLKHLKVSEVSTKDIETIHRAVTRRGPYQANRTRSTLSRMFRYAVEWGWRPDNPVAGVRKNKEHKRARYLTSTEMPRLSKALAELNDQQAADIFRFCLLTGARRGEVRAARWKDLDLAGGFWVKPPEATKQNKEHRVPLSPAALSILLRLRKAAASEAVYVFPGEGETGHRIDLKKPWRKIIRAAGIEGVRVHDLRHSFASLAVNAGYSLPFIGALLGHADPETTARYAHLYDASLKEAVARIGDQIEGIREGGAAEVANIEQGRRK
jgi:integrase